MKSILEKHSVHSQEVGELSLKGLKQMGLTELLIMEQGVSMLLMITDMTLLKSTTMIMTMSNTNKAITTIAIRTIIMIITVIEFIVLTIIAVKTLAVDTLAVKTLAVTIKPQITRLLNNIQGL